MSRPKRKTAASANDNVATGEAIEPARVAIVERSHEMMERIAFEVAKSVVVALQDVLGGPAPPKSEAQPTPTATTDVMTADDVAAFLGVDRNTVYDFAGQGVIPHQRLGKRGARARGNDVAKASAAKTETQQSA